MKKITILLCFALLGAFSAPAQDRDTIAGIPVNYDELKVGDYKVGLPDPLVFNNGKPVKNARQWKKRRAEILKIFEENQYGKWPAKKPALRYDVQKDEGFDGTAVRKQITLYFSEFNDGPRVDVLVYLPKDAVGQVPVLLNLSFSPNNMVDICTQLKFQTIGHDKVNQLRHVRFFGDIHGMVEHMRKHADILRPKFEMVENILEEQLGALGIGTWTKPLGGYFIHFESLPGCAKAIVARAKKAGVVMTSAGATWPYGKDPNDNSIRIAPTNPSLQDLHIAAALFSLCVKLVSAEKLLAEANEATGNRQQATGDREQGTGNREQG